MRNSELIYQIASEVQEQLGGSISKIYEWLLNYSELDGRKTANESRVREMLNLDWDYISHTKYIHGVEYLYFHNEEMGSI